MKTELSVEETKVFDEVVNYWLNVCFSPPENNDVEIENGVKWLYELAGLGEPLVFVVDSPLAVQYVCNLLNNNVYSEVRADVGDKVFAKVGDKVRAKVGDKVRDEVLDKVRDEVRDEVGDKVIAKVRDEVIAKVDAKVHDKVIAKVRDEVIAKVRADVGAKVDKNSFTYYSTSYDYLYWCVN